MALDGTEAQTTFQTLRHSLPNVESLPDFAGRLPYLFDAAEAASVFQFPLPPAQEVSGLPVQSWAEPDGYRPTLGEGCILGAYTRNGVCIPVRLGAEDRLRSVYMVGKTGTGKTTALISMILDDINAGHGVCVIDPHGDLFRAVLGRIPDRRAEDVVLIDPADADFPVGLNPLELRGESDRHFIIQEFIGILARLIEDEFGQDTLSHFAGPVFFQHVRMGLLLAMSDPTSPGTLLEFYNIFQERGFWERWLPLKTQDPLLARWVEHVLPRTNYLSPGSDNLSLGGYVASKFEGFVFDPRLRNIFAQKHSTINLSDIIAAGKILLVNLAKGELTETNSRFMGMLLLAALQTAALSCIRIPEKERRPFFVYVDEFQSVASQNFVSLVSEGRKFGLGLVLANQFISQVRNARIMDSLLGNVGTLIAFRVGPADAEIIEREMRPEVSQSDLLNLPNHRAYLKALANGEPARPFVVQTVLPANPAGSDVADRIRTLSRNKYAKPRANVEEEITRSLKVTSE